ncbi:MAG: flagellar hook-basal body complex protein FliE [Rhodospirillales bacterium]|nr:flagellar hook-basal body complex protein FliE [Rhodospirillales bacterium]
MSSMLNAIKAYSTAAKFPLAETDAVSESAAPGQDFASFLKNTVKDAIDTTKDSERLSKQAVAGKADVREVVAAVANAEVTLETVVAVRDKVISAYNDILRMPI